MIDRAKITAEERLDDKHLLSTSDPDLSAEDVALGYKNLLEVERGPLNTAQQGIVDACGVTAPPRIPNDASPQLKPPKPANRLPTNCGTREIMGAGVS